MVGPGGTHFSVIQSGLSKAGQQTLSDKDVHLSGQTFALPGHFDRTRKQATRKKMHFHTITFQEDSHLFSSYIFCLLVGL